MTTDAGPVRLDPSALSPSSRALALAELTGGEVDVLVVGGGVVGAGAALDATTRGTVCTHAWREPLKS